MSIAAAKQIPEEEKNKKTAVKRDK